MTRKSYIGQTVQRFAKRKNDHLQSARRKPKGVFHLALRKYGEEAFDWEILMITNEDSLNHFEEMLIRGFGTVVPAGYNILAKSENVSSDRAGSRVKEEDANLPKYVVSCVSMSKKGVKSFGYRCQLPNGLSKTIVHSSMTMQTKLELLEKWMNEAKKNTVIQDKKRVTSSTGVNDLPLGVYVECDKGYYVQVKGFPKKKFCKKILSMTEKKTLAIDYLKRITSTTSVPDLVKYQSGVNHYTKKKERPRQTKQTSGWKAPNCKKVDQYTLDGTFMTSFSSLKEAAISLQLSHNASRCIGDAVQGKQNTAYGYKWKASPSQQS